MESSRRGRFATAFVRYWGANMQQYVWAYGYEWPGFGYGPEDRALLERWAGTVGASFLIFTLTTVVLFMLLACAILAVVLGPVLMSDPATTPAAVFLAALGASCILAITVGMPLSMLGGALLASRFEQPFTPSDEDARDSRRVYRVVIGQIRRVGIIGGILVPIGSFLMLISTTFDRVITLLATVIPWILIGVTIVEVLSRAAAAPE